MSTVAGHIDRAEKNLDEMAGYHPGEAAYHGLAQSALAHVLAAVAILLDGQEQARQAIPGLPDGYQLTAEQSAAGSRKWRYVLTSPDGIAWPSRYRWDSPETAVADGIRDARAHAGTGQEPRP